MLGYPGGQERTANDGSRTRTQQICTDKARYESHNVTRTAKRHTHSHTHSLSSFPGTMTESVVAGRCRRTVTHKPPQCGRPPQSPYERKLLRLATVVLTFSIYAKNWLSLCYYGQLKNQCKRTVAAKHYRLEKLVAYSRSPDAPKEISAEESVDAFRDVRITFFE